MTKCSNKSKKPYFWPILPIFGTKKNFFFKSGCHTQHIGLEHHAEFQKKLISQSQENFQTEGWKDRRMEGQTDNVAELTTTKYAISTFTQLNP